MILPEPLVGVIKLAGFITCRNRRGWEWRQNHSMNSWRVDSHPSNICITLISQQAHEDHDTVHTMPGLRHEVTGDDLAGAQTMMDINSPQARPPADLLRSQSGPIHRDASPLGTMAAPGRQRHSLPSIDVLLESIRDDTCRRDSAVMTTARDANLRRFLADQQVQPQMTALEHRRSSVIYDEDIVRSFRCPRTHPQPEAQRTTEELDFDNFIGQYPSFRDSNRSHYYDENFSTPTSGWNLPSSRSRLNLPSPRSTPPVWATRASMYSSNSGAYTNSGSYKGWSAPSCKYRI